MTKSILHAAERDGLLPRKLIAGILITAAAACLACSFPDYSFVKKPGSDAGNADNDTEESGEQSAAVSTMHHALSIVVRVPEVGADEPSRLVVEVRNSSAEEVYLDGLALIFLDNRALAPSECVRVLLSGTLGEFGAATFGSSSVAEGSTCSTDGVVLVDLREDLVVDSSGTPR
ncbi:MAG: hypothetical protein FWD57_06230 [Polyangiaceae bacterium]|nr:hypothetical protein [Polyangiaceae bacterium]